LLLSSERIRDRTRRLARVLRDDCQSRNINRPVLLCTLKGACPFYCHLAESLQQLRQGYDMEFLRVSSYDGTQSTGNVEITKFGDTLKVEAIRGRHVLIVEDIVDTGTTLSKLVPHLEQIGTPKSIQVVTLLDKRLETKKYQAKYVGFSVPDMFVVGYGLDYNELYRDLQDIFIISKRGIDFDASTLHKI